MYKYLQKDKEKIDEIIDCFGKYSKEKLDSFDNRAIGLSQIDFDVDSINNHGIGFFDTLKKFDTKYEKYLSASMGSRYFGFVTGGSTPASLIGDWLSSLYDNNVASLGESSSSDITLETIHQLKNLFELNDDFDGVFVSGATMSNFVGLATARQWIGKYYDVDIANDGLQSLTDPIHIYSASAHSSIYKSLSMLGLGKNSLKLIKTNPNSESIDIEDLKNHLKQHKSTPCIIVANCGTVNTVSFDDLKEISKLREKYNFWLHVDAAFGGFARCSDNYKHLIKNLEDADSITIDAHKWLNVPYDSAMHFTKHLKLQFEVFQNSAAYLNPNFSNNNYVHLTPENSQRLRALPVWFSLNAYGKKGYEEIVEKNCNLAYELGDKIKKSDKFILLSDVVLNGVLFTMNIDNLTTKRIDQFIQNIKEDGKIFITPSQYQNKPCLRVSISNWQTTQKDMDIAWNTLNNIFDITC